MSNLFLNIHSKHAIIHIEIHYQRAGAVTYRKNIMSGKSQVLLADSTLIEFFLLLWLVISVRMKNFLKSMLNALKFSSVIYI